MVNEWTRDDLPDRYDLVRLKSGIVQPFFFDDVLDAVVAHLNANGGTPVVMGTAANNMLRETLANVETDRFRWRRAHSIVEQERDQAREALADIRSTLKATNDAMVEAAERERDEALEASALFQRDVHAWRTRAEAAEARTAPAVNREDVEKAIRDNEHRVNDDGFMHYEVNITEAADAVCAFFGVEAESADPAVFVVRESDLPEVSRTYDGWTDGTRHGWEGTSETAMECVETHLEWARFYLAASRAIEAEPADPVEQKARELYEVGNPGTEGMWESIHEAFKDGYRRIARHVLGQEASDE